MALATPQEYAALQRATQYAHYTPEPVVRALWRAAQHLGFAGGRVLEPGMGTGLFFALLPEDLRGACRLTGVEYDPVTARIARFVHPQARVRCEDYTRSQLAGGFDLTIGNPPFADRIVRADPTTASPWSAAARLLHRPLDRAAPARGPGAVRDQHRDHGQGEHSRSRAHRRHGGPGGRRALARREHACDRRDRCRYRRFGVSTPKRGPGAGLERHG